MSTGLNRCKALVGVLLVTCAIEPAELRSQEVTRHDLTKREPDSRQFPGDVIQVGR